jgi:hypothetical protein
MLCHTTSTRLMRLPRYWFSLTHIPTAHAFAVRQRGNRRLRASNVEAPLEHRSLTLQRLTFPAAPANWRQGRFTTPSASRRGQLARSARKRPGGGAAWHSLRWRHASRQKATPLHASRLTSETTIFPRLAAPNTHPCRAATASPAPLGTWRASVDRWYPPVAVPDRRLLGTRSTHVTVSGPLIGA